MSPKRTITILAAAALTMVAAPAFAAFTYNPPGELTPGSGQGRPDTRIYVPNMRFPLEKGPAYANSQVWGHGGNNGPGGGQCDSENYSYPWWDNFCETRSWDVPMCPGGTGHQGQDIRPSTCEKNKHWAVAAEAGTITHIGTYTVYLQADNGVTRHRYLHMEVSSIVVSEGDHVAKGDRLGRVSNNMGNTPTTIHLHYDLHQNVAGVGDSYVPPYMSLIDSYQRLMGIPQASCSALGAGGGTIDDTDPCFELHGPPASWRYVTDTGHDGDLHWTYAWDNADPGNWAQWHIQLDQAGTYKVEVFTVSDYAQAHKARYGVRHDGQEDEVRLDFGAGDGWRSLGEFDFAAGADQFVAVYDNTGEALSDHLKIIADAVRLTRVDSATPDAGSVGADAGASGHTGDAGDAGGTPDAGAGGDTGADAGSAHGDPRTPTTRTHSATTSSSCSAAGGQQAPGGLLWVVLLGVGGGLLWRRDER